MRRTTTFIGVSATLMVAALSQNPTFRMDPAVMLNSTGATITYDLSASPGTIFSMLANIGGGPVDVFGERFYLDLSPTLVTLSAGECNFHIFHEALVGLDASQVAAYRAPGSASACAYLRAADEEGGARSEEKDAAHFQQTTGAFNASFKVGEEPTPSFVLMDLQGTNVVTYVYELHGEEVAVKKIVHQQAEAPPAA